jgi:hypothetical protein
MLAAQRDYLTRTLSPLSAAGVVHAGLSFDASGKMVGGGVDEAVSRAGWASPAAAAGLGEGGLKGALVKLTLAVINSFPDARHFQTPVDVSAIKDYVEKVKAPMGAWRRARPRAPLNTAPRAPRPQRQHPLTAAARPAQTSARWRKRRTTARMAR